MSSNDELKLRRACYKSLLTMFKSNPDAPSALILKALDAAAPDYAFNTAMETVFELMESGEESIDLSLPERFASEGMLEMRDVLPVGVTAALNAHVNAQFNESRLDEADVTSYGKARRHLKLQLFDGPVANALQQALPKLEPVIEAALGPDCILTECTALIVDAGSDCQPLHADTMWTPHAEVLAVFLALQDVTSDMGPTQMLPKTHTDPIFWQKAIEECDPKRILSDPEYLQRALGTPPLHECQIGCGTAMVMDTRLLHCGGANRSNNRRTLFYLTFAKLGCAKDIDDLPEDVDLDANVSVRRIANSLSYQRIAAHLKEEYGSLVTLQGLVQRLSQGDLGQQA